MSCSDNQQTSACTVCASSDVSAFVEIPNVPVLCNILWDNRADAEGVLRVDLKLAYCNNCGHIFNPDFNLALLDYSQEYENSLHFSPRFQQYAEGLARDLVDRHTLTKQNIIEIGSGKGDFLEMICELGDNRGIGFDPSYIPGTTERSKTDQIEFVQDFYSQKYTDRRADFIICRHTLEHVEAPVEFMKMVRNTVGDRDTTLFFEVPNGLYTLRKMAIWDIIYEHCSFFTEYSLAYLFEHSGFEVTDVRTTFGEQYLCIEAKPKHVSSKRIEEVQHRASEIADDIRLFSEQYLQKIDADRELLHTLNSNGQNVVIWGAGSKGITFLNLLDTSGDIKYAVDLNPRKQGKYITGSGQRIVPPDFLANYGPDAIIVMNPLYLDEIKQMVLEIGLKPRFLTA